MRIALISTGERGEGQEPLVAGRSLVLRQFDFALACGAEKVVAYLDGHEAEATDLREAARREGVHCTAIASAHALVALVGMEDELLVLQPGLLPEAEAAIAGLSGRSKILSLPASETRGTSFERIDADSFWAGALVVPGELVGRLEELPEDADPHAALLRIALQERTPREPLERDLLADGSWGRLVPGEDHNALTTARLRRGQRDPAEASPSRRLASAVLARCSETLLATRRAEWAILLFAVLLFCAGPIAAWFGLPALAFALLATGVPVLHLGLRLKLLSLAAFRASRLSALRLVLPDMGIFLGGILVIDGDWHRRLFPPLVLLVALNAAARTQHWRVLARDRGIGCLLIAVAAIAGWQEQALMAWALLALAAAFAHQPLRRTPGR